MSGCRLHSWAICSASTATDRDLGHTVSTAGAVQLTWEQALLLPWGAPRLLGPLGANLHGLRWCRHLEMPSEVLTWNQMYRAKPRAKNWNNRLILSSHSCCITFFSATVNLTAGSLSLWRTLHARTHAGQIIWALPWYKHWIILVATPPPSLSFIFPLKGLSRVGFSCLNTGVQAIISDAVR